MDEVSILEVDWETSHSCFLVLLKKYHDLKEATTSEVTSANSIDQDATFESRSIRDDNEGEEALPLQAWSKVELLEPNKEVNDELMRCLHGYIDFFS